MPNSLGLVDFAIGLVNPVLDLPGGKVKFWGGVQLTDQKNRNQFFSLVKMTLGLVYDFLCTLIKFHFQHIFSMAQIKKVTSSKALRNTHHRKATLIGVVKQEVNKSAGSSGFIGSSWFASHDASWMQFLTASGTGIGVPCAKQR